MRLARRLDIDRDDRGDWPQYVIEGRFVLNRAESWLLGAYFALSNWWLERVWWPGAVRVLHAVGRHHSTCCRGRQSCSDDMRRRGVPGF